MAVGGEREVGRGEREAGRGRGAVHGAVQPQPIHTRWQGRDPALPGPEGGRVGVQEHGRQQRLHPGGLVLELLQGWGVDGDVQPDPEQPPLPPGQAAGQRLGVGVGHLGMRVREAAVGGVQPAGGFQAGQLAAQPLGRHRRRDRQQMQGDIDGPRMIQQRFQPAGPNLPRVAGHGQRPIPDAPGLQGGRGDPDRLGAGQPSPDRGWPPPAQQPARTAGHRCLPAMTAPAGASPAGRAGLAGLAAAASTRPAASASKTVRPTPAAVSSPRACSA
jgi:hypothetical protein